MEVKVGDIVETTYTNITNKIGKVIIVFKDVVAITNVIEGDSVHLKSRIKIIKSE